MVKKFIVGFFLLLINQGFGQIINFSVSTDSTNYTVGDYINLIYTVEHEKSVSLFFPSVKDGIKSLEFIEQKPVQKEEKENIQISKYAFVFAKYDSGGVTIPSIIAYYKVKGDSTLYSLISDSLQIVIHTVTVDTSADIMDIKEPITIPLDWRIVLLIVLGILVLLGLSYFIYKKIKARSNKESDAIEIVLPAHEEALMALKALESQKLWQGGKIKEYHTEITGIIRRYFERRFLVQALEMPTSEIILKLQSTPDALEIIELTKDFLNNADMVKFAKFVPMVKVNEEMMEEANQIVEITAYDGGVDTESSGENENV